MKCNDDRYSTLLFDKRKKNHEKREPLPDTDRFLPIPITTLWNPYVILKGWVTNSDHEFEIE